jgi:multimeric flavodoxin WrbA
VAKNILAFSASPRRGGNSSQLLEAVTEGIVDAGGVVTVFQTHDMDIAPCTGCGHCATLGRCVIEDGFQDVFERVIDADGIVFASPLYFMNVPARGKVIIDRSQSFWAVKHMLGRDLFGGRIHRAGLLVACAGANAGPDGSDVFRGIEDTMTYVFDAWGVRMLERCVVAGVDEPGAVDAKTGVIDAARERGRELVRACSDGGNGRG